MIERVRHIQTPNKSFTPQVETLFLKFITVAYDVINNSCLNNIGFLQCVQSLNHNHSPIQVNEKGQH